MAETVKEHRFATRYPWDQWANGQTWELTRSTYDLDGNIVEKGDFDVKVKSLRGAAWLHARDYYLNLRTSVHVTYKVATDDDGNPTGEYAKDASGNKIVVREQVMLKFTPMTAEEKAAAIAKEEEAAKAKAEAGQQ